MNFRELIWRRKAKAMAEGSLRHSPTQPPEEGVQVGNGGLEGGRHAAPLSPLPDHLSLQQRERQRKRDAEEDS